MTLLTGRWKKHAGTRVGPVIEEILRLGQWEPGKRRYRIRTYHPAGGHSQWDDEPGHLRATPYRTFREVYGEPEDEETHYRAAGVHTEPGCVWIDDPEAWTDVDDDDG